MPALFKDQKGIVAPPLIILLVILISTAIFLVIRNLPVGEPQATPDKGFEGSASGTLNDASPSASAASLAKPLIKQSPSPSPKPGATNAPGSNSNSNSASNATNSNSNSGSNTNTSNTNTTTEDTGSGLSVSPSSMDITIKAGTEGLGPVIKSIGATDFTISGFPADYQTVQGTGFSWNNGTNGGINAQYPINTKIGVNSLVPAGTYNGSLNVKSSKSSTVITVPLKITVTAADPAARSIKVSSPNGGENLPVGSTATINWETSGTFDKYQLYYKSANGSTNSITDILDPNIKSYSWQVNVGNTTSTQFKIMVLGWKFGNNGGSVEDLSDNFFTVSQ